ncbi:MAG: UxaA family hydrolase [Janthinobacterium lividum]
MNDATFQGFVRADGRVGTRNHIGVFVVGNCGATAARHVADHFTHRQLAAFSHVDEVLPFVHEIGCGMEATGEPMNLLRRTIAGTVRNPNIAGAVVIALGCERNNIRAFFEQEGLATGPLLHMLVMQEIGGTAATIEAGIAAVASMLPLVDACRRETVSARHLVVGLQSDAAEGEAAVVAHRALGVAVDLLVAQGGTAILSETSALAAVEDEATARAASAEVAEQLGQRIRWWKGYTAGRDTRMTRPATAAVLPGAEALSRAGTSPLKAVYEYAHSVTERGLVFMDAPAYAAVSATGQIASGATLLCVVTGGHSGFGAAAVPTLKLVGDSAVYARLEDDLDIDCGPVREGAMDAQTMGEAIFQRLLAHASGVPTKSEELGVGQDEFVPWPIGVLA